MLASLKKSGVAALAIAMAAAAVPAAAQENGNDQHHGNGGQHGGGGEQHGRPPAQAPQPNRAPAAQPQAQQAQRPANHNAWEGGRPPAAQPQGQRPANHSAWEGGRPPAAQPQGQRPANHNAWEGNRPPGGPPPQQPGLHEAWQGAAHPQPQGHNAWQGGPGAPPQGRPANWDQGRAPQGYYPGSGQRWSRDWHNDHRYDWHDYRYANRGVYHLSPYYAPYHGWGYRQLSVGFILQPLFYGSAYWIGDPYTYRLPPVYGPYRWVRYYNDALLVNIYTGEVVDVVHGIFW
jgi:hypothetical protein